MKTITFNARLFVRENAAADDAMVEARMNLSADAVCEFVREISINGVAPRTQLLIETLIDGENYQQYLSRELPGTIHGGFVFNTNALRNAGSWEMDERCQDFRELAEQLTGIYAGSQA